MSNPNYKRQVKKQAILYKSRDRKSQRQGDVASVLAEYQDPLVSPELALAEKLKSWCTEAGISRESMQNLLKILHDEGLDVPLSAESFVVKREQINETIHKGTVEKQHNTIIEILAEHKVLLDRILRQNTAVENNMINFPINSDEDLHALDLLLASHPDTYKRQMQLLLAGNAEKYLHQIFGQEIILNYNVNGISGKKRLRDLNNLFSSLIEIISSYSPTPDNTLRAAFQRQKKKFFKQTSRNKTIINKQESEDYKEVLEGYEEIW